MVENIFSTFVFIFVRKVESVVGVGKFFRYVFLISFSFTTSVIIFVRKGMKLWLVLAVGSYFYLYFSLYNCKR